MGPLELRAYKLDWVEALRFRRNLTKTNPARGSDILAIGRSPSSRATEKTGFAGLRKAWVEHGSDMDEDIEPVIVRRARDDRARSVSAADVAARLLFARLFDERPDLLAQVCSGSPVVVIDVADTAMLAKVISVWRDTLLSPSARVMHLNDNHGGRSDYDIVLMAVDGTPKDKQVTDREREALWALGLALPLIAMSPSAETHLARAVLRASPVRIQFPAMDPVAIARTIRVVTGRPCRELLDGQTAGYLSLADLLLAIRFDRSPQECMDRLRRLAAEKSQRKSGRDIELDEIHGMNEAVTWARASIRDLNAWRRGEIPWSAVSHAICLEGPPGTGKTMFAASYAAAANAELISCSLASWQGADEGHLGHLLRAMRKDFAKAREKMPCVLFIDEIDSFADRSKVRHAHADYVTQVVNAFIAELDGVGGREGLLFCAASNDLSRCDPAILRSGRFSKIVRIGFPDKDELERMFRVRLRSDLVDADLRDICLLGLGSTGADVERIVEDARRLARHADRAVDIADLRHALLGTDMRDTAQIQRTATHEAGHVLMDYLLFGEVEHLYATIAAAGDRGGVSLRTKSPLLAGTYEDYSKRLQIMLAGRLAEEIALGALSHGGGGSRGSDLDQATRLAAAMVASLGLAGRFPLLYLAGREETDKLLSYPEVRRAAHDELMRASDSCRRVLLDQRQSLERIAMALLRNGSIDGDSVAALVDIEPQSERLVR